MNLRQINFRQPKYIFPLVIALPAAALIYFIAGMFSSGEEEVATDHINMELPEAQGLQDYDKLRSMENRYEKENNTFTAIDGFDNDEAGKEKLGEDGYSEDEIKKIIEETERKQREQQQLAELQKNLDKSNNRLRSSSRPSASSYERDNGDYDVQAQLDDIRRRADQRMKSLINEPDPDEKDRAEANRLAREQELARQKKEAENAPKEVVKASSMSHSGFNTVADEQNTESPLIKAMIDQTTKSTDGTRLRFKLLDDVVIDDVKLLKGTYIYGTVTGFDTQRVKANITSILAGSRFIKVDLSVYDVDGMEGFYVPASSFREFVKDATAGVAGSNINFNNNSDNSSGINPSYLALQALQNIYQAGSSAISKNAKKNKAKIKYNTIVYLINTKNL